MRRSFTESDDALVRASLLDVAAAADEEDVVEAPVGVGVTPGVRNGL